MKENIVDIFNQYVDTKLERVHTLIPGEIVSYNGHSTRKASVRPLVQLKTTQNKSLTLPIIENVPVQFPGSPTFQFLFPLPAKTGCLIGFAEAGIGNFLNSNGQNPVDADDLSRFDLTDAICIPGLYSFTGVPKSPLSTLEIDEAGIMKLNGESKSFVTHTELNVALQTFMLALNLHIHSGVTTGPGVSGPPTPMTLDISASQTLTVKTGG